MFFKTIVKNTNLTLETLDDLLSKEDQLFEYYYVNSKEDKFIKYSLDSYETRFNFVLEENNNIEIVSDIRYDNFDDSFKDIFENVLKSHYTILTCILKKYRNIEIGFVLEKDESVDFYKKFKNYLLNNDFDLITQVRLSKYNILRGYRSFTNYIFQPVVNVTNGILSEFKIIMDVVYIEPVNDDFLLSYYKYVVTSELDEFLGIYNKIKNYKKSFFENILNDLKQLTRG